jgi:type I restriction enzyme, S subunit
MVNKAYSIDRWKYRTIETLVELSDPGVWGEENSDGVGVLRSTNFTNSGKLNLRNVAFREIEPKKLSRKLLKFGDILLERSGGGPKQPVGRVVYFDCDSDYVFGNFIQRLRANSGVISKFLFYQLFWMHHSGKTEQLQQQTTGIRNLNFRDYMGSELPVPPLSEQRKIADILVSVDDAITATQRIFDQTEVVKHGLMQQLLTRGISHKEFKQTEIGEIPTEWGTARLRDVAKVIDCKHYTPEYTDSGVPIIRTNDLTTGDLVLQGTNYTSEEDYKVLTDKYAPKKGDIIYGREGSFGIACYADTDENFSIGQRVVVVSPYDIQSRYLHLSLNSNIVLEQVLLASLGTTVKRINVKDINDLYVPVPPVDEQKRITDAILPLIKKLQIESQTLKSLNQVKIALMQSLLTGKVRVNVDDPSEVPV